MTIIWKNVNENPGHISLRQTAFKYFQTLNFLFFFSPPKKRYWLKLSKPLYKMMPEYSPLALLFAAFNEGKSEPTKARVSIAEDTIALAVPALGPQPGCAPSWCREIEDKGSVSKAMNTYI